jgi:hypothetical protein
MTDKEKEGLDDEEMDDLIKTLDDLFKSIDWDNIPDDDDPED